MLLQGAQPLVAVAMQGVRPGHAVVHTVQAPTVLLLLLLLLLLGLMVLFCVAPGRCLLCCEL
jgi:hypothetical protein